jgi:hypothetical protein
MSVIGDAAGRKATAKLNVVTVTAKRLRKIYFISAIAVCKRCDLIGRLVTDVKQRKPFKSWQSIPTPWRTIFNP